MCMATLWYRFFAYFSWMIVLAFAVLWLAFTWKACSAVAHSLSSLGLGQEPPSSHVRLSFAKGVRQRTYSHNE